MRLEVEKLKKSLSEKESAWVAKRDEVLKKSKDEAKDILRQAKEEADDIIRTLRAIDKKDAKDRNKAIEEMRNRLKEQLNSVNDQVIVADALSELPPETLRIGDNVRVLTINQDGTVLTEPNDKKEVTVQVGLMKMAVPLKQLILLSQKKRDEQIFKRHAEKRQTSQSITTEIDVRGENIEDAIVVIDKYLDDAALSSLTSVRIIHGKGTGALRKGLHEHFKHHPHVKHFEFAAYNEGGNGATVIQLK